MDQSPHLDPSWLRQRYEVDGLSTYDLGRLIGRDPKSIYAQLRKFGIPTRSRGLNLKGRDNYVLGGRPNVWTGRRHREASKALISLRARRPKPWLRGGANGMSGRTGASNPNYKDGSAPERQRLYAHGANRALLRYVYLRDGFRCARCGAAKTTPRSLHAHHVRPWGDNPLLRFDAANLITLCRPCHSWVHSRRNEARSFLA